MPMRRKRFGQNFLHDSTVINRIIDEINPTADDFIVEIGPGEGVLTAGLIESNARVLAIEIDRDLTPRLQSRFGSRLEIINADVLKTDWNSWLQPSTRLVGNLPYNISTPLLLKFCQHTTQLQDITVMMQKEVGERLVADCGSNNYGRLTISVDLAYQTSTLFNVPPSAFSPPPKVQSSILRLLPHNYQRQPPKHFNDIVNKSFQQRRKTVQNALSDWAIDWQHIGIDPSKRPAELTIDDYIAIANSCQS